MSRSVKGQFLRQENRQHKDRSWCISYFRTLDARVVNIVCDRQRSQNKSAEPLRAQKKATNATTSHSEPLKNHREPRLEKNNEPLSAFRYWPGLAMERKQKLIVRRYPEPEALKLTSGTYPSSGSVLARGFRMGTKAARAALEARKR